MGATWCRERIEQVQNSKFHVDRIIARCSNAIYSKYAKKNHAKLTKDIVFKPTKSFGVETTLEHNPFTISEPDWIKSSLRVSTFEHGTPIPPPRKKRKRKNTLELLSNHLDKICAIVPPPPQPQPQSSMNENEGPRPPPKELLKKQENDINLTQDIRRKNRAKKIMETKTKCLRKEVQRPLSLSIVDNNIKIEFEDDDLKCCIPKTISSTSLPNYLEFNRHLVEFSNSDLENKPPQRNSSMASLPGESMLAALSQVTKQRIESYMRKCKSFGSQPLIQRFENNPAPSESEDSWSGLEDWDLGIIEHCDPELSSTLKKRNVVFSVGPPLLPKRRQKEKARESGAATPPLLLRSEALKLSLKTPPPSPNEFLSDFTIPELDTHKRLLEALNECKENLVEEAYKADPPNGKSRKLDLRRESLFIKKSKRPSFSRSASVDHVADAEPAMNLSKSWQNLGIGNNQSPSQHQQALSEFIGFDASPGVEMSKETQEVNLNSSLFPVVNVGDKDKAAVEMDDDHKTPQPPPLPSSFPPTL